MRTSWKGAGTTARPAVGGQGDAVAELTRRARRSALVALALCLAMTGRAALVYEFEMGKNVLWRQTSATPSFTAANASAQNVDAMVKKIGLPGAPGEPGAVLVTSSASTNTLTLPGWQAEAFNMWYATMLTFGTRAELDAAFPDGARYRFEIEGGPDDGSFGTIDFTAPVPGTIPRFTNYEAIQAIDAAKPFRFAWGFWGNRRRAKVIGSRTISRATGVWRSVRYPQRCD